MWHKAQESKRIKQPDSNLHSIPFLSPYLGSVICLAQPQTY
jgi:hypothetical protein